MEFQRVEYDIARTQRQMREFGLPNALIRRLAEDGVAVVVVSSEIEEVLGLSDRVLVVGEGTVLHESPADQLDEHQVLDIIMRGDAA